MTTVSIAIAADPRRKRMAEALADEVDGHIVWDECRSEWDTHVRAWRWCVEQGTDWGIVLQDDAVPADGFLGAISDILEGAPEQTCVGLYIGTSRPPRVQPLFRNLMSKADMSGDQWIRSDDLYWGVGVAIPHHLIEPALNHRSYLIPYDERLGSYFRRSSLPILYTWPSLVDHQDTPTLIKHADGQPRLEVRRAWRTGIPGSVNGDPLGIRSDRRD